MSRTLTFAKLLIRPKQLGLMRIDKLNFSNLKLIFFLICGSFVGTVVFYELS